MRILEQGTGQVVQGDQVIRLIRPSASTQHYSNAQIDDYGMGQMPHTAPTRLRLKARFSHSAAELKGTAGFGFWNNPFAPRLPKSAWFFFGSQPLNLALAAGVRGHGFKAATLDSLNWRFLALLPTAPLGFILMRNPWFYRHFWPIGQAALKVSEAALDLDLTQWHDYELDWQEKQVVWRVNGQQVHQSPASPKGRMGLVIWLDNQYAIVTPQGHLGWGLLAETEPQWLEIEGLNLLPRQGSADADNSAYKSAIRSDI